MHLIFGLGPIGGNIGRRLSEIGRETYGFDLSAERAQEWAGSANAPAGSDPNLVDWPSVDTVFVAVRTAEQVVSVFESLQSYCGSRSLTVFVLTTLAVKDSRDILSSAPAAWRVFEAPLSGGPQGAREGTATIFLSGPECTAAEERLLADVTGRVFRMPAYGDAAMVKLLNNTLGAYNLLSTALLLNLAERNGLPAQGLPRSDPRVVRAELDERPLYRRPARSAAQRRRPAAYRDGFAARCGSRRRRRRGDPAGKSDVDQRHPRRMIGFHPSRRRAVADAVQLPAVRCGLRLPVHLG